MATEIVYKIYKDILLSFHKLFGLIWRFTRISFILFLLHLIASLRLLFYIFIINTYDKKQQKWNERNSIKKIIINNKDSSWKLKYCVLLYTIRYFLNHLFGTIHWSKIESLVFSNRFFVAWMKNDILNCIFACLIYSSYWKSRPRRVIYIA